MMQRHPPAQGQPAISATAIKERAINYQQVVKWTVYTLLLLNWALYIREDWLNAQHTLRNGGGLLDWTGAFGTSLDEAAWFGLLALWELETYALSEHAWTRWVRGLFLSIRGVCYVFLAHTVFAWGSTWIELRNLQPSEEIAHVCELEGTGISFTRNLDYTLIDEVNPYPYHQMLVTLAPPLGEPGFGTTVHDDWLRLVIAHEYVHVLQLDMASRLPLALRSVFGRLYFPNALQPEWLVEGLATYEETEQTAGGRGRSPGAEMVLRMASLEGPFPTLEQMAVLPDEWPAGQVPYLFGESFIRFLVRRFGREKVAEISRAYGGRPLPFLVTSTGREALGADYRELWREWSDGLRSRFQALPPPPWMTSGVLVSCAARMRSM